MLGGCAMAQRVPTCSRAGDRVVWHLPPLRIHQHVRICIRDHGQTMRFVGSLHATPQAITLIGALVGPPLRGGSEARVSHLAICFSWAGAQKIVYHRQPPFAVRLAEALHLMLDFPSKISVLPEGKYFSTVGTFQSPAGTTYRLWFMNGPGYPWRVVMTQPDGPTLTAKFSWTRHETLRSLEIADAAADLRCRITAKFAGGTTYERR